MRQITTDEIVRILCGDTSSLDEVLEDVRVKNNTNEDTNEDNNDDSSGVL